MNENNVIPLRPRSTRQVDEVVGEPMSRRAALLLVLASHGKRGMNWIDVSAHMGLHHGAASALLSTLHKAGEIVRLTEKREGCSVYVEPHYVDGRQAVPYRINQQALVDQLADVLRRFYKPCRHDPNFPHATCKQCEVGVLLRQYETYRGV